MKPPTTTTPAERQAANVAAGGDGCCHHTRFVGASCPVGWKCPFVKETETTVASDQPIMKLGSIGAYALRAGRSNYVTERPTQFAAEGWVVSEIRHGLFLTYGRTEDGRLLAICSDGTPQLGHDPVSVLTLEVVKSTREAKRWFDHVKQTRPWETWP